MHKYQITSSIVTYHTDEDLLKRAIDSLFKSTLKVKLYIVDNSPTNIIKRLCSDTRVEYIFNNANLGYGVAHNIALRKSLNVSKYHLVLNPDVYFDTGTLENVYEFMEHNADIGLLMPKILYPDGSVQHLCKLLPNPFDLIARRFIPLKGIVEKRNEIYELKFTKYNKIMDVPYLSGCFMFLRCETLKKVGLFDKRFFMYPEDVDLSRRIHSCYRTVFYPKATVFHAHARESYESGRLLYIHIMSMIKYFNKWGWFFDAERRHINRETLRRLQK